MLLVVRLAHASYCTERALRLVYCIIIRVGLAIQREPNIVDMVQLRARETGIADPVLQEIADSDTVRWWRKRNLRMLYFLLLPAAMGTEITSGFDSQLINALQLLDAWNNCELVLLIHRLSS